MLASAFSFNRKRVQKDLGRRPTVEAITAQGDDGGDGDDGGVDDDELGTNS